MENENTCRHGNTLDRPCDACHPEHIEILHAALTRAQTVLATIINAGLTFDGGVGGKFIEEIRATEIEARKALCFDGSSPVPVPQDGTVDGGGIWLGGKWNPKPTPIKYRPDSTPSGETKPEFDPAWVCGACGKRHGRGECSQADAGAEVPK